MSRMMTSGASKPNGQGCRCSARIQVSLGLQAGGVVVHRTANLVENVLQFGGLRERHGR